MIRKLTIVFIFLLLLFCSCSEENYRASNSGNITFREQDDFVSAQILDVSILAKLTPFYDKTVLINNDTIISNYNYPNEKHLIKTVEALTSICKKTDISVFFATPPRKLDVLKFDLPDDYPVLISDRLFRIVKDTVNKSDAEYVNIYDVLLEKEFIGEEIYLRTDHHWTSLGAYYAYVEIAKAMGFKPYDLKNFEFQLFTNSFKGSDSVKIGENSIPPDSIYLMSLKNDSRTFHTEIREYTDSGKNTRYTGFYDLSCLYTDEKYSVFLSGNNANVKITCEEQQRETLLMIRDSFANALAPFLALHYDLVLIDPRFYNKRIGDVIENDNISKILIVENMGSLCEQNMKLIF